jgi:hypothetical protein
MADSAGLDENIQPLNRGSSFSPGRFSWISIKAAFSGRSSGALFSQSRTSIDKVKNVTGFPTGASKRETRAVILSSPCMIATGSAVIPAAAPVAQSASMGVSAASAPRARPSLIGDKASSAPGPHRR